MSHAIAQQSLEIKEYFFRTFLLKDHQFFFRNPVNEYMKTGSVGNFKLNEDDSLTDSKFESKPPNRAGVFRMVYG